jgi:arylsulfatase A-like enzyme
MTDDQPIKDTMTDMPQLRERVRDRGMTLPNTYVSGSLRCPSRASIFRAQYPHNNGVMRNGPPDGVGQTFHAFERIGLRMPHGSRLLGLVVKNHSIAGCANSYQSIDCLCRQQRRRSIHLP